MYSDILEETNAITFGYFMKMESQMEKLIKRIFEGNPSITAICLVADWDDNDQPDFMWGVKVYRTCRSVRPEESEVLKPELDFKAWAPYEPIPLAFSVFQQYLDHDFSSDDILMFTREMVRVIKKAEEEA